MGITVIVSYPLSLSLQVEKLVRALVDIELEEWDFLKRFKLGIPTTKPDAIPSSIPGDDPIPPAEPPVPSLDEPDPGVYHRKPAPTPD